MSEAYQALTATSNRSTLSTQASTTLACCFFVIRVFLSRAFTLAHNFPALFFLLIQISSVHTTLLTSSAESSPPNSSLFSLLSFLKVSVTISIALTQYSRSSVSLTGVVSSAKKDREKLKWILRYCSCRLCPGSVICSLVSIAI